MTGFRALEWLARIGFLVKGVLYVVVGVLALQVSARLGGRITGTRGALITVLGQPFGRILLVIAAIGLFGYAAWRILQGFLDPDGAGRDWRGLAKRTGYVARGVAYAALGLQAVHLYRGVSSASGAGERTLAVEAMQWPFGEWLLVLAGLGLVGLAIQQVSKAIKGKLERNLDVQELRRDAGDWAVTVSRFGIVARAVIFAMLGWFLIVAGWQHDPSEVGTTASSLRTLASQPGGLGRWLLAVTAAGLIAYGFYQVIHARYLRINRIS